MTAATETSRPGAQLANGSIVIQQKGDVVLCVLPHNEFTPYATWAISNCDIHDHRGLSLIP